MTYTLDSILRFGDPRLQTVSAAIANDEKPLDLAQEAEALLRNIHDFRAKHGWGRAMAAPQMGIMKRMIAVVLDGQEHVLVNPEVTWASESMTELWDDCMSLPEIAVRVLRHDSITVRYQTLDGKEAAFEKTDLDLSELLQHELDHLDGIIMTDRMIKGSPVVAHENRMLSSAS